MRLCVQLWSIVHSFLSLSEGSFLFRVCKFYARSLGFHTVAGRQRLLEGFKRFYGILPQHVSLSLLKVVQNRYPYMQARFNDKRKRMVTLFDLPEHVTDLLWTQVGRPKKLPAVRSLLQKRSAPSIAK